jgi:hypothetical protein
VAIRTSVADPDNSDMYPDLTFHFDTVPDPDPPSEVQRLSYISVEHNK